MGMRGFLESSVLCEDKNYDNDYDNELLQCRIGPSYLG